MINDEYEKTLLLLIEQKKELITIIKNNNKDLKLSNEILENIYKIDSKIKEYHDKIKEEKNNNSNIIYNNINEHKNIKKAISFEEKLKIEDLKENLLRKENEYNKINNKINENKLQDPIIEKLDKKLIDNIIENEGKTDIPYINKENNIKTIFSYKNKSKNFYYYQCKKRPLCKGKCKFNKLSNELNI